MMMGEIVGRMWMAAMSSGRGSPIEPAEKAMLMRPSGSANKWGPQ